MSVLKFIDPNHPYNFLVHFTRGKSFLTREETTALYQQIHKIFADFAYNDITIKIPESMILRIHQIDLPILQSYQPSSFTQLLANICKVAQCHFPPINGQSIYQIKIPHPEKQGEFYWGWIHRSYVDTSQELKRQLNDEGDLILKNTSPTALWALQKIQNAEDIPSEHCKEALRQFIDQWHPHGLNIESIVWKPIQTDSEEKNDSTLFNPKDPYESLKRFVSRSATQTGSASKAFLKDCTAFFRKAAVIGEKIVIPSSERNYFAKIDLPFLLSTSFTDRTEQMRLIASIQEVVQLQFCSLMLVECSFGKNPEDSIKRWIKPDKLDWAQSEVKPLYKLFMQIRHEQALGEELAMNEFILTMLLLISVELNFTELKKKLLKLAERAFTSTQSSNAISTIFCQHFENQHMPILLHELNPLLTPNQNEIKPHLMGPILLHNMRARPQMSLISLIRITFNQKNPEPELLGQLYNEVDDRRKIQLLDFYIQLIHRALKSELDLLNLQGFCRQLAFNEVYYVPTMAISFYEFLKSQQVFELFPHQPLLLSMLNHFPKIYFVELEKEQLKKWREKQGQKIAQLFVNLHTQIYKKPSPLAIELHSSLERCFMQLNIKKDFQKELSQTFSKNHHFLDLTETISMLLLSFKQLEPLMDETTPQIIIDCYQSYHNSAEKLLQLSRKFIHYKTILETHDLFDVDSVDRLMNLIWCHSQVYLKPADKPLSLPLQVKWLKIIKQLPDDEKIDLASAAQFLCLPNTSSLPLKLYEMQNAMVEKQISKEAQELMIDYEMLVQAEESFLIKAIELIEDQDSFMDFLKEANLPEELHPFKERLIHLMEPTFLTRSYLWLSQMSEQWNKTLTTTGKES